MAPAEEPRRETHTSQYESETMIENEELRGSSQMVMESNANGASAPHIAKNIDGQTTLRTYCVQSSSELLPGIAAKGSIKS